MTGTTVLTRLVGWASDVLTEADGTSVVLGSPDEPELITSSSASVAELDQAQLIECEGPTADAFWSGAVVATRDLRADPRWVALGARLTADRTGTCSCVAVPVRPDDQDGPGAVLGVLTVYGAQSLSTAPVQRLLLRFAAQAAALVTAGAVAPSGTAG